MRSFKDLNVSYKPEDGKKRFPGGGKHPGAGELTDCGEGLRDGHQDRTGRGPLYRGH